MTAPSLYKKTAPRERRFYSQTREVIASSHGNVDDAAAPLVVAAAVVLLGGGGYGPVPFIVFLLLPALVDLCLVAARRELHNLLVIVIDGTDHDSALF